MSQTSRLGCRFLIIALILLFLIIGGFSYGFYSIENMTKINSVYFTLITVGTIGYGDITPQKNLGKILCICLIITSIFIIFILFRITILIIVDSQINNLLETIKLKKQNPGIDLTKKANIKKISSRSSVINGNGNNKNDIQMTQFNNVNSNPNDNDNDNNNTNEEEFMDVDSKKLSEKTEEEIRKQRRKWLRPLIYLIVYMVWLITFILFFYLENNEKIQFYCPEDYFANNIDNCIPKNNNFKAFLEVFYFSIITSGAIGYGDHYPLTKIGKLFINITSIFGVIFMAILSAEISNIIINCFGVNVVDVLVY